MRRRTQLATEDFAAPGVGFYRGVAYYSINDKAKTRFRRKGEKGKRLCSLSNLGTRSESAMAAMLQKKKFQEEAVLTSKHKRKKSETQGGGSSQKKKKVEYRENTRWLKSRQRALLKDGRTAVADTEGLPKLSSGNRLKVPRRKRGESTFIQSSVGNGRSGFERILADSFVVGIDFKARK